MGILSRPIKRDIFVTIFAAYESEYERYAQMDIHIMQRIRKSPRESTEVPKLSKVITNIMQVSINKTMMLREAGIRAMTSPRIGNVIMKIDNVPDSSGCILLARIPMMVYMIM